MFITAWLMGSSPYAFILETNLYQNFNTAYPFFIKTRRSTSLRKMYQSPFHFNYLFKKLLNSTFLFSVYLQSTTNLFLSYYYLDSNVWHFYRNLTFKNSGSLTNNISLSLVSKTLFDNILSLSQPKISSWTRLKTQSKLYYLKEVRLLPFALKKNTFNSVVFLILFVLAQPLTSFLQRTNLTYSFLFISNNINLFTFYSYFYFKVYNF
jgi:hypothetical protein